MVNGNAQRYATIIKHSEKFLIVIQLQLCISVFVQTGFSGSVDKIKNEYWLWDTVIRQGCQCRLFILLVLKRNFKFFGYFFISWVFCLDWIIVYYLRTSASLCFILLIEAWYYTLVSSTLLWNMFVFITWYSYLHYTVFSDKSVPDHKAEQSRFKWNTVVTAYKIKRQLQQFSVQPWDSSM